MALEAVSTKEKKKSIIWTEGGSNSCILTDNGVIKFLKENLRPSPVVRSS
jgi:hypothetical protein